MHVSAYRRKHIIPSRSLSVGPVRRTTTMHNMWRQMNLPEGTTPPQAGTYRRNTPEGLHETAQFSCCALERHRACTFEYVRTLWQSHWFVSEHRLVRIFCLARRHISSPSSHLRRQRLASTSLGATPTCRARPASSWHTHMSCPHPHGLPANTPALTEVRRDAATYEEKEKEEQQQEVVCLQLCPFRRRVPPTPRRGRTCAKEVIDGANVLASHLRVLRSKAASQASAHTGAGERPSGRPRCGLRVGALCALPCHATHVIN